MRPLVQVAALAALAAYTDAICVDEGTFVCDDFEPLTTTVDNAVVTYAGNYEWTMLETTTGYLNKMFKFVADDTGNPVADQGTLGPVLFVHTATKSCLSWLTDSVDENTDAIPKMLFDQGYDVYLACRRGTSYSRAHETFDLDTEDGLASYFNYNTDNVGTEDIEQFVDLILTDAVDCTQVQIVTHGYGAAEVYAGLAEDASTLPSKVSNVTNLAPCLIPTNQLSGLGLERESQDDKHNWRRALSEKQTLSEPPRELHEVVEEDMPKRELSGSWYYGRDSYWARTEQYCLYHPDACFKYCDWYPSYCDEFCWRLPQYCVPDAIRSFYTRMDLFEENGIVSLYSEDWATQVEALCLEVDADKCQELRDSVDSGKEEMSVIQREHMFQQDFNRSFSQYSSTFETDQTTTPIDVTGINTRNRSIYVIENEVCDTVTNAAVMDTVPGQVNRTTMTNGLTHRTIFGANNDADLLTQLAAGLNDGQLDDAGDPICSLA